MASSPILIWPNRCSDILSKKFAQEALWSDHASLSVSHLALPKWNNERSKNLQNWPALEKSFSLKEPVAAAIGAGLPITEPCGNMIVDIGGGTTDIAVISLGGIVYSESVRMAGDQIDGAIMSHLKREYSLLIGEHMAERIKIEIGSAHPPPEKKQMAVKGRDVISGIPRTIFIDDAEVREALQECITTVVTAVRQALERTPPELAGDIIDRGIVLTGGGSLLQSPG